MLEQHARPRSGMLSFQVPLARGTRSRAIAGCLAFVLSAAVSGCSLTKESAHKSPSTSPTTPANVPPGYTDVLRNGTFAKGTAGWSSNVTLGRVVSFRAVRGSGVELVALHARH